MVEVTDCVICGGGIRRLKRALVAPFVAERTWKRKPFCVDLVKCESCGFIFYNPRLDDADLRNLYLNYRSDEYQKMRYASEPWYTQRFNRIWLLPVRTNSVEEDWVPSLSRLLAGARSAAFWTMEEIAEISWPA